MKTLRPLLLLGILNFAFLIFNSSGQDYATAATAVDIPTDLAAATAGASNSTSGLTFRVPQNRDLIIQCTYTNSNAVNIGSNIVAGFDFTVDGTQYTTTHPVTVTLANAGTGYLSGAATINRTNVTGYARGRFSYLSATQTNAATVVSISIGVAKNP